jgi:predicted Na+-dependent transporter
MAITYALICGLLILLCLSGLGGVFFFREYVRKISCLSIAYSNFLILIVFISLKSSNFNEIMMIMVSILVVFSVNLLIGISLVRSVATLQQEDVGKEK